MELIMNGTRDRIKYYHTNSLGRTNLYSHRFEGLMNYIQRYASDTTSEAIRIWAESFMAVNKCRTCGGGRLNTDSLWVRVGDKGIYEVTQMSISECRSFC